MQRNVVVLGVSLAALALLLWLLAGGAEDRPVGAAGAVPRAEASAVPTRVVAGTDAATADRSGVAEAADAPARVPIAKDDRAVIFGRCVDEDGLPLANVAVKLHGSPANTERMERYTLDHGPVEWADPEPAVTTADGRFAIRFVPPSPFQFSLRPQAEGRVIVRHRLSAIAPRSEIDLGDIALPWGVAVTGRLVGEDGIPIANRGIWLHRPGMLFGRSRGDLEIADNVSGETDAGGGFAFAAILPEGAYVFESPGLEVLEPRGPVELVQPATELRIVARARPPDQTPKISGQVLDAHDQPIARASIRLAQRSETNQSGRDGHFELRRRPHMPATPAVLSVMLDGYADWISAEPVPWGTEDLRVVLIEGPPLTIRVRRADDGTPIERFGVVFTTRRAGGPWLSGFDAVKHVGDHQGGELVMPHVTPGTLLLSVVPAESTGLPTTADQLIEITAGVARVIDIAIAPLAERIVEVVGTGGEPRAGVVVELCEHSNGVAVTLKMLGMSPQVARYNTGDHVVVLHDTSTTDAQGRATLRGHGGGNYALRLPGPGHAPLVVQPFRLEGEGIARVTVGTGATLRGRITPLALVTAIKPALRLSGTGSRRGELYPSGLLTSGIAIEDDGRFNLVGVPAGIWDVQLVIKVPFVLGDSLTARTVREAVELRDGEQCELVLDLPHWLPQSVEIELLLDARPYVGLVEFVGVVGRNPDGSDQTERRFANADAAGKCTPALLVGTWRARIHARDGAASAWLASQEFVVAASQTPVPMRIDLQSGRARLLIVDPDGAPVGDLPLQVRGVVAPSEVLVSATDASGHVTLLGPPGSLRLLARRAPLRDAAALEEWSREHGQSPDAWLQTYIEIGTVQLEPGEAMERELRLPLAWRELPR